MRIAEEYALSMFAQEQLSAEVIRAQRMAELEQIAKYRALKIQKYKEWADPEKRAEIQAQYEADRQAAIIIVGDKNKGLDNYEARLKYYEGIGVREGVKPLLATPVAKIPVKEKKKPWYKRIFGFA